MRIKPDELVAGFPAKKIRDLLRQSGDFLSVHDVTKIIGEKGRKAICILECLESEGFIEKDLSFSRSGDKNYWKLTAKGGAMKNALFSAPVSRQTAEKALNKFIDRIRQVNADERFLYRVRKAILFGSYLTERTHVGDLDIAIDLSPKEPDHKKHADLILARADQAAREGRRFRSYLDQMSFAYDEVMKFLKARSRIIQFTECRDGILSMVESRVIYEYDERD
jgi:predicted nucleotidyltransferase